MNRKRLILILLITTVFFSGCQINDEEIQEKTVSDALEKRKQAMFEESEELAEGYRDIYKRAKRDETLNSLEVKQELVEYFGMLDYAALDTENQIEMVCAEQVEDFCESVQAMQSTETTIFVVADEGGFVRYDMISQNGKIDVTVSSYSWEKDELRGIYYQEFPAYTWKYTENGYFFIEEYQPPGYDGAPGQTGFRVKPLDKMCRELNRKYVLPIGYDLNKLLITDWNENNYKNLDFYDLYELMYRLKYGVNVPYDDNYGNAEYEIPKKEFEEVVQTYLPIESGTLEENAVYQTESQTYRYRMRGFYECESPDEPYPEVVKYEEQEDGTIKLTINAVWTRKMLDKAITSELVVRPLENGNFQYLSNHLIPTQESIEPQWYKKRLSDEEWKELYLEDK